MLDFVLCEYELPLPKEAEALDPPPDWGNLEFQTKSFLNAFDERDFYIDKYNISEDGQLYKDDVKREFVLNEDGGVALDEKENGIIRVDFTGRLDFWTIHLDKEYDYYVEFATLFWKGDLKEIDLKEWKREDNKQRLEAHKQFSEQVSKAIKRGDSKIYSVYKKIINYFFGLTRWFFGWIIKLAWMLERWLLG